MFFLNDEWVFREYNEGIEELSPELQKALEPLLCESRACRKSCARLRPNIAG